MYYPALILLPGREKSLQRKHPWVFSGAIDTSKTRLSELRDGCVVVVLDSRGEVLGTGHYQKGGSISVRILAFAKETVDHSFWCRKISDAFSLRKQTGLVESLVTNCYRLIHGEGDGLPGLIVDYYNGTAVMQAHSEGMRLCRRDIAVALKEVMKEKLHSVYDKSADLKGSESKGAGESGYLAGSGSGETEVTENGNRFFVSWKEGQKTGFFLDQRESRKLVASCAKGREVLNLFSYTGGFSVYALQGGARSVSSVDSSAHAIGLAGKNIELNGYDPHRNPCVVSDAAAFLKDTGKKFDMIILDPPAFAKSHKAKHNAIQGYRRINEAAIRNSGKNCFLFTFSCSQAVDRQTFTGVVTAAAIEAGRNVRILSHLPQPQDHPVSIFHPEGEYLKGLLLHIG